MTRRALVESLVVLSIVGIFAALILPGVQNAREANGGPKIPTSPPDEARRITNDCGLSIVLPDGWVLRKESPWCDGDCCICINNGGTRRIRSQIAVNESRSDFDPAQLDDCEETTLLGLPARRRLTIDEGTFDDPGYTTLEIFIERNEQRWTIDLLLQGEYDTIPDELMQYAETIQLPPQESG